MAAQTRKWVLGELKQFFAPLRLQGIDTYHSYRLATLEHWGERTLAFGSNWHIDFKGTAM